MKQKVIILRGAPASGKTTIAKSYRDFDKKIAWLKVDNFKDFFAEDASEALDYVNGSAIATLKYLLENGFSIVIDGIFQDTTAIDDAISICHELNIPVKVFELKVSLNTLKERDSIREGVREGLKKPLGDETVEKIYNTLSASPYQGAVVLNTEENNIKECKEIINNSFG